MGSRSQPSDQSLGSQGPHDACEMPVGTSLLVHNISQIFTVLHSTSDRFSEVNMAGVLQMEQYTTCTTMSPDATRLTTLDSLPFPIQDRYMHTVWLHVLPHSPHMMCCRSTTGTLIWFAKSSATATPQRTFVWHGSQGCARRNSLNGTRTKKSTKPKSRVAQLELAALRKRSEKRQMCPTN